MSDHDRSDEEIRLDVFTAFNVKGMVEVVPTPPRTAMTFEFGVRLADDPAVHAAIEAQAQLAHETYNRMIEICRAVYGDVMAYIRRQDPRIAGWESQLAVLSEQWRAAKADGDRDRLLAIAAERRPIWSAWREAVWAACKAGLSTIRDEYLARLNIMRKTSEIYRVRAEAVAGGLYFDTASEVMRRARQAYDRSFARLRPPRFRAWGLREQDTFVLQINDRPGGLTMGELRSGDYGRLFAGAPPTTNRRRARSVCYVPFRLRVAPSPDGPGKRGGIDAVGTVFWHRDVPDDARITYARLVRRRIASHWKTWLQLVVQLPTPYRSLPAAAEGAVAVQLNWREDDNGRRVLSLSRDGVSGQTLRLEDRVAADLQRCADIGSTRSQMRDAIVAHLRQVDWSDAPEALAVIAQAMTLRAQDIAPSWLAAWVLRWRSECPHWRTDALDEAECWRRRDKRAWERESHIRRRTLNRRDKQYQGVARMLVTAQTLAINRPNLQAAARIKDEVSGEHTNLGPQARSGRQIVALSRLEHWIETKAAESGTTVVRIDGRMTWTCADCHAEVERPGDHAQMTEWSCPHCGAVHDRDVAAARNVWRLAAAAGKEIAAAGAAAVDKVERAAARRAKAKVARTEALRGRRRDASAPVVPEFPAALAPAETQPDQRDTGPAADGAGASAQKKPTKKNSARKRLRSES